ncbi:hypothetical protein XM47_17865 [Catenovulum maritimum]|uniref:Cystathionine gamma-synthase n=2 Tax=Catenovulum maritimum TaxID=1513271 RepID=A0A0J8GLS5_9ALTE|nr:cystathionine gamma-synthase family protein [Catenovulum maritimum]KMT63772.1 hypothetical protein XM47_17865 [Catenovulum maritimum]
MKEKGFTTQLVHAERLQSPEHGAIHQATNQSVLFHYQNAQDLVDVFQGKSQAYAYARQSTPSTNSIQNILASLEQAHDALVFATGMAALTTTMLTLLKARDHVLISRYVFGNTNSFAETLTQLGIELDFIDVTDIDDVRGKVKSNTRIVFTETIANPVTQVADITEISKICNEFNLLFIVDNTMTPSYLFNAKAHGAHLIITSLTKYFGGHGNALGGAVIDTGLFDWCLFPNIYPAYQSAQVKNWGLTQIKKKGLRDIGASISSESIHHLSVGSETLALRMDRSCSNAMKLAEFLEQHPKVKKVYYPGLESHPQHLLAKNMFKYFGAIMSFDLSEALEPLDFINKLNVMLCSTHLGDNRSLVIPVAPTIYHEMGLERRQSMGISETMIRLSVGIEDIDDLISDLSQALG